MRPAAPGAREGDGPAASDTEDETRDRLLSLSPVMTGGDEEDAGHAPERGAADDEKDEDEDDSAISRPSAWKVSVLKKRKEQRMRVLSRHVQTICMLAPKAISAQRKIAIAAEAEDTLNRAVVEVQTRLSRTTVWVGGIPETCAQAERLRPIFLRFGPICSICVRVKADKSWCAHAVPTVPCTACLRHGRCHGIDCSAARAVGRMICGALCLCWTFAGPLSLS